MKIEEAIEVLENGEWFEAYCTLPSKDVPDNEEFCEALDMAVVALRAQQETGKNEPLTETELMQMVGHPIWIMPTANAPDRLDWDPAWVIMREDYVFVDSKSHESRAYIRFVKDYGKTWIAYRNPPEGDDSL